VKRLVLVLAVLLLSAAHCALRDKVSKSPQPAPTSVLKPSPATQIEAPAGYVIEHYGDAEDLRLWIKNSDPELFKLWTLGSLITLQKGETRCAFARVGAQIRVLRPCPLPQKSAHLASDAGEHDGALAPPATRFLPLVTHRFGVPLVEGWAALAQAETPVSRRLPRAWLEAFLAPIGQPLPATDEILEIQIFGADEGAGLAFAFELSDDLLGAIGRFDLKARYGGQADYVNDVRAWGDGRYFQGMLRLHGGGVGLRLQGKNLRLAVYGGADWQQKLDALLRSEKPGPALFPLLQLDGWAIVFDPERGLSTRRLEKPLPTAALLGQLAARLKRWRSEPEEDEP
jgi:hypothetical protein